MTTSQNLLHLLSSGYNAQHFPSAPSDSHNLLLKKKGTSCSIFFLLFAALPTALHSFPPFSWANFIPVCNYSPVPKLSASLFVSRAPSFISLVCLNLPRSRQAAYLSALPLSRVVSQREGKKTKEERLAKIKGPGPLPKAQRLPTAIYLPFASHTRGELDGGRESRETNAHNNLLRQQWHPNRPKGGTFRQTYGFVLLGWTLGCNPSHLITSEATTATVCLWAQSHLVCQGEPNLTDRCLNHSS